MSRWPRRALVLLLRAYQAVVSPLVGLMTAPGYGQTCRFYPSCSEYAVRAVEVHGVLRGGWLAARRLGRCHPWNPGGVDHVPGTDSCASTALETAVVDGPGAARRVA